MQNLCRKILKLLAQELIPVIAPIGKNKKGQALNNNADTVTGFIANSLSATRFLLLTNVKGVLNQNKKLIEQINPQEAKKLIKNKIIVGGMRKYPIWLGKVGNIPNLNME